MLRKTIEIAAPLLRMEAEKMPRERRIHPTQGVIWPFMGRGVLLLSDMETTELRDGDQRDGDQLWWHTECGLMSVKRHTYDARCWNQNEDDPSYDWITTIQELGMREVVRRYGGEEVAGAIIEALVKRAEERDQEAACRDESTTRMRAALDALRGST